MTAEPDMEEYDRFLDEFARQHGWTEAQRREAVNNYFELVYRAIKTNAEAGCSIPLLAQHLRDEALRFNSQGELRTPEQLVLAQARLAREVYEAVCGAEDVDSQPQLGADLSYLMGAILKDGFVEWDEDDELVILLATLFPATAPVWKYIHIEEPEPRDWARDVTHLRDTLRRVRDAMQPSHNRSCELLDDDDKHANGIARDGDLYLLALGDSDNLVTLDMFRKLIQDALDRVPA